MRIILFLITLLCLLSCRPVELFKWREYWSYDSKRIAFYPDNSFRYLQKMEGGYVYEYGRGKWKQERNKIFLNNDEVNIGNLSVLMSTSSSITDETQIIVTILPKRSLYFSYLPIPTDQLNIDLMVNKTIYPLKDETSIFRFQTLLDSGYFRAYPKDKVELSCEILNDTLRSKYINFRNHDRKILNIEIDCDPINFARIKLHNDTLKINSNNNKITWGKTVFERAR